MNDLLAGIKTGVAGKHVADADTDQKIIDAVKTKQFRSDEQGCDRTVGDAAEDRYQAKRCEHTGRIKADQSAKSTAECCTDKKEGTISPPL